MDEASLHVEIFKKETCMNVMLNYGNINRPTTCLCVMVNQQWDFGLLEHLELGSLAEVIYFILL